MQFETKYKNLNKILKRAEKFFARKEGRRWGKNTAGQKHKHQGGQTAAYQLPVRWRLPCTYIDS